MKTLNFNWSVLKRKLNIQVELWNHESTELRSQADAHRHQRSLPRYFKMPAGGGPVPGPYAISAFNSQLG